MSGRDQKEKEVKTQARTPTFNNPLQKFSKKHLEKLQEWYKVDVESILHKCQGFILSLHCEKKYEQKDLDIEHQIPLDIEISDFQELSDPFESFSHAASFDEGSLIGTMYDAKSLVAMYTHKYEQVMIGARNITFLDNIRKIKSSRNLFCEADAFVAVADLPRGRYTDYNITGHEYEYLFECQGNIYAIQSFYESDLDVYMDQKILVKIGPDEDTLVLRIKGFVNIYQVYSRIAQALPDEILVVTEEDEHTIELKSASDYPIMITFDLDTKHTFSKLEEWVIEPHETKLLRKRAPKLENFMELRTYRTRLFHTDGASDIRSIYNSSRIPYLEFQCPKAEWVNSLTQVSKLKTLEYAFQVGEEEIDVTAVLSPLNQIGMLALRYVFNVLRLNAIKGLSRHYEFVNFLVRFLNLFQLTPRHLIYFNNMFEWEFTLFEINAFMLILTESYQLIKYDVNQQVWNLLACDRKIPISKIEADSKYVTSCYDAFEDEEVNDIVNGESVTFTMRVNKDFKSVCIPKSIVISNIMNPSNTRVGCDQGKEEEKILMYTAVEMGGLGKYWVLYEVLFDCLFYQDEHHLHLELKLTKNNITMTQSGNVFNQIQDLSSSVHCGPGSDIFLCDLFKIDVSGTQIVPFTKETG